MLDLQGYESSIFDGAIVTLQVALLSLILAVFLGLLGALAKMAPYRWARGEESQLFIPRLFVVSPILC